MRVSDYIVESLIGEGITDIFGYPGGMVTYLTDSLGKREKDIHTHITYHEQGAAFAACGYAQGSGKLGVAFATSGPGATNLITGIGNAFFDSIPTLFITGQVNTFESKKHSEIRQKGFQETDIVSMVKGITKAAYYVSESKDVPRIIQEACSIAMTPRKGPVLVDIPMNIFRENIENIDIQAKYKSGIQNNSDSKDVDKFGERLADVLSVSKRPCLILGNGIKSDHQTRNIREIIRKCPIPVVSSMIATDIVPEEQGIEGIYFGFVGAYGNRSANFVVAKSDLVICLGTRLDVRQVGGKRECFAPNAHILRVDIDKEELNNKIRDEEESFNILLADAIPILSQILIEGKYSYSDWLSVCREIKTKVKYLDEMEPNRIINCISKIVPDGYSIVADVGQHMVWTAQSFKIKPNQELFFSGGMGSMGYAVPAAIGLYYATKRPVICFVGDGGFQMNIQELQFLAREQIPVKMIVLNNQALGMIRHFQEMYFDANYFYTVKKNGYTAPDFTKIARAYGIKASKIGTLADIDKISFKDNHPELFEVVLKTDTYVFPKLEYGKPNQDQEPLIDRTLYDYLMKI